MISLTSFIKSLAPYILQKTDLPTRSPYLDSNQRLPSTMHHVGSHNRSMASIGFIKLFKAATLSFLSPRERTTRFLYLVLSAFRYDLSGRADEASDRHRRHSEHDLHRYRDVVKSVASSLQIVHDMHGLGTILVEISYWQCIDEILEAAIGAS